MEGLNPIELQKYLKGVSYPAKRNHLICKAVENGADMEVVGGMFNLPDREFASPAEVSKFM